MSHINLVQILITFFISPLGYFCVKGELNVEFFLNLVLYIVTVTIAGAIHAFSTYGINICTSILCWVLLIGCSNG